MSEKKLFLNFKAELVSSVRTARINKLWFERRVIKQSSIWPEINYKTDFYFSHGAAGSCWPGQQVRFSFLPS